MSERLRDRACIVGIGETAYAKRGTFADVGQLSLAATAIRAACADAGIESQQIDGFTSFGGTAAFGVDASGPPALPVELGVTSWRYATTVWGGGGSGLPTAILNAVMAVTTGVATYVAVSRSIVQGDVRFGEDRLPSMPINPYSEPFGYGPPMMTYAMRARRHFELYGTTIDDLATVAVTQRDYAVNNPNAVFRRPLTVAEHHNSRVVVDPFRLFDCCMESDGAAALIITTPERAKDLNAEPIFVGGVSTKGEYRWSAPDAYTEPDEYIASSGHAAAASDLWRASGVGPEDIDVAGFYDGSSISPILAVEDWGFCPRGEGGSFIRSGAMRRDGALPINTAGGNLSEAFMQGTNHLIECVRQLRGTSHNQVPGAEVALYASGQGILPAGGILIHR